jgi:hypothetical protein
MKYILYQTFLLTIVSYGAEKSRIGLVLTAIVNSPSSSPLCLTCLAWPAFIPSSHYQQHYHIIQKRTLQKLLNEGNGVVFYKQKNPTTQQNTPNEMTY